MYAHNDEQLRELYRELILDHARNPRHFGKLADATHTAEGINPLCGDKLKLYLRIVDDQVDDMRFEGSGCAISVASASLLGDTITGLTLRDAERWFETITGRLTGRSQSSADGGDDLGKLGALEGVKEFPSRVKCATLAWHALHAALHTQTETASTE